MGARRLVVMTLDDLDPVLALERISFGRPWSRDFFLSELECVHGSNYTVKEPNDEGDETVIGYVCFRIILDEMHLLKIAVHPRHRSRGVGAWMMRRTIGLSMAMGATTAFLEVRSANVQAVSLYQKCGFRMIGVRPAYYIEDNEDALIMNMNLKEVKDDGEAGD